MTTTQLFVIVSGWHSLENNCIKAAEKVLGKKISKPVVLTFDFENKRFSLTYKITSESTHTIGLLFEDILENE